jgi:lipopolysaccharide/colanic/teichoic acid biosynthesis glycosyltransferase
MWQQACKRAVDIAGATVGLALLSPLFIVCALAIRASSPGTVFFRQKRLGRGGRPFLVLKFRTMYLEAPDIRNSDGSSYCGEDDPRVTPVGRVLRLASLDELPQLLNVLAGQMSLVGPRPDQADQIRFYSAEEKRKLCVRPGLTGLAQISGRNSITWGQRKVLDLEYVSNQSLWRDLTILCKTIPYVVLRRGIYTGK